MRVVFYSPAPYPDEEEERQRVVDVLIAANIADPRLEDIVSEAAAIFDVPIAAVTILDHDRQWLAVRQGTDATVTCRAIAFCGHTIGSPEPLCVTDATQDSRFEGNPLVTHDPNIRFYAGARLVVSGMAVGALCAIDAEPASKVAPDQLARLQALARKASLILHDRIAGGPMNGGTTAKVIPLHPGTAPDV